MSHLHLTAETILAFLQVQGLIDNAHYSGLSVTEIPRRNYNMAISLDGQPKWFVKQVQYALPEAIFSQYREAECYNVARKTATLAKLSSLMPRLVLFDAAHSVLITELLDGVTAADGLEMVGDLDATQIGTLMGKALATAHDATPSIKATCFPASLPGDLPWVLKTVSRNQIFGERTSYLASYLDQNTVATRQLAELREGWLRDTLIHGDARPDNFLLCRPLAAQTEIDTRIIDWELVDIGDWAWDCAGVMQHFCFEWLRKVPSTAGSWLRFSNLIRSFWSVYAEIRGLDPSVHALPFKRAMRYTGARLIQTAYENYARAKSRDPLVCRCELAAQQLLGRVDLFIEEMEE